MKAHEVWPRTAGRPGDPRQDEPVGLLSRKEGKVQARHLDRLAVVYVRQSSPQQVQEHRESGRLQYDLRGRAAALGWPADRVIVIDEDQGRSGKTAAGRPGFQRLLAEVGLDRVGLILGIEMSRLARSCRDWHQLLELCALFQTVLADRDALYDPTDHNDRLLLGLSGIMSEAGAAHPAGPDAFAGSAEQGRDAASCSTTPRSGTPASPGAAWMLDPDEQARDVVRLVFDKFDELGTVSAAAAAPRPQRHPPGRPPPLRARQGRPRRGGGRTGRRFLRDGFLLHNPGLRRGVRPQPATDRSPAEGARPPHHRARGRAEGEWEVLIHDHTARLHHMGAVRVEPAEAGQNGCPRRGHAGRPGRGTRCSPASVSCGRCGRRM